jgi:hypothetical protein
MNNVYENICRKALNESKKDIVNNLANEDDIIEITIINNIATLTKETGNHGYIDRQTSVLRFINESCKLLEEYINMTINIGLGDTYYSNLGIMIFAGEENTENIIIPDYYAMDDYNNMIQKDNICFENKKNKAIFIGSSTGDFNPKYNERLNLCNKYSNNTEINCYINKFCQINMNLIINEYPNYQSFSSNYISIATQLEYKFIISIDGNTTTWDRIPWIFNSNSVCLKKKSNQICWYYEFMLKDQHYIEFEDDSLIETIINTISINECQRIIKNANIFVDDYLKHTSQKLYMSKLLYYLSIKNTQTNN